MFRLCIANKNYSSWSLRPWTLMRELGIEFEERLHRFGDVPVWRKYRETVPSGRVPALLDGSTVVWDSLSIVEYLAERVSGVWPGDAARRTWARSATAEMHSGFDELRSRCSMNCGIRVRLADMSTGLVRDIARLEAVWQEGLDRFGGPFLAGEAYCAVDAFYAPVAFRVQTYALDLAPAAAAYVRRLLLLDSMRAWYEDALKETYRDEAHERDITAAGEVVADFRVPATS